MSRILLVSHDIVEMIDVLDVLTAAGYEVRGAASFEEASRLLAACPPDLVIADERLGEFNGLHVIVRARADHPGVSGIVTTPVHNLGLESDARGLNVECLVRPKDPAGWLGPVWRTLHHEPAADDPGMSRDAVRAVVRH
jgi:DNA-binding NtrC family response regulator